MQTAFAMAANCALDAHIKYDKHAPSLSLAQQMLQLAQETAQAMQAMPQSSMAATDMQSNRIAKHLLMMVRGPFIRPCGGLAEVGCSNLAAFLF